MAKKRRRGSGHFCWCCRRILANERFSGHGHARHLCKPCSRLPAQERADRQELLNLERCFTWEGAPRRKCRKEIDQFLVHPRAIVRETADKLLQRWTEEQHAPPVDPLQGCGLNPEVDLPIQDWLYTDDDEDDGAPVRKNVAASSDAGTTAARTPGDGLGMGHELAEDDLLGAWFIPVEDDSDSPF